MATQMRSMLEVMNATIREEMERDVQAMHEYGLWATMQKDR